MFNLGIFLICFAEVNPVLTGINKSSKIPKLNTVPIIVVTASSITREMVTYFECNDLLQKPIEEKKLVVLLHKYLFKTTETF